MRMRMALRLHNGDEVIIRATGKVGQVRGSVRLEKRAGDGKSWVRVPVLVQSGLILEYTHKELA